MLDKKPTINSYFSIEECDDIDQNLANIRDRLSDMIYDAKKSYDDALPHKELPYYCDDVERDLGMIEEELRIRYNIISDLCTIIENLMPEEDKQDYLKQLKEWEQNKKLDMFCEK